MGLIAADGAPSDKDTVLAVVGATAALTGLVLVFLGLLATGYQTLLGRANEATLARFRIAAWISFGGFLVCLASLALGVAWLSAGGGHDLYVTVLAVFFAELTMLAAIALYVTWRVLLRG